MTSNIEYLKVPYGLTVHGEEEIAAVVKVLRTSTQMGKNVRQFEQKVAALFDKKHGIMVNSGTSALFLAAEIIDLPAGSEVITPVLTFATTVSSLVKNNLTPVFVDVEEGTYLASLEKIKELIGPETKAICIPNLLGNIPAWDKISEVAREAELILIEDSADTLGGTINNVSSGAYSDISITSFYGSHIINCAGNGGMLCVNNEKYREKALLLRSWGRTSSLYVDSEKAENRFNIELDSIPYDAKFVFDSLGYNFEPSEMGAAFGLVQLEKLESNIGSRTKNYNELSSYFGKYEEWFVLPRQTDGVYTGWLAFALTIRPEAPFSRRDLQMYFETRGIQTRVIFTGNILRQPGFRNIKHRVCSDGYPVADNVMTGGMLIACHHGMTLEMMDHIKNTFANFARDYE
jgi:CDP-4-dehydro-6-deoxyglucose reductase, E1